MNGVIELQCQNLENIISSADVGGALLLLYAFHPGHNQAVYNGGQMF